MLFHRWGPKRLCTASMVIITVRHGSCYFEAAILTFLTIFTGAWLYIYGGLSQNRTRLHVQWAPPWQSILSGVDCRAESLNFVPVQNFSTSQNHPHISNSISCFRLLSSRIESR
jgi:hypothetical protein